MSDISHQAFVSVSHFQIVADDGFLTSLVSLTLVCRTIEIIELVNNIPRTETLRNTMIFCGDEFVS